MEMKEKHDSAGIHKNGVKNTTAETERLRGAWLHMSCQHITRQIQLFDPSAPHFLNDFVKKLHLSKNTDLLFHRADGPVNCNMQCFYNKLQYFF